MAQQQCAICGRIFEPFLPYGIGSLETRICGNCIDDLVDDAKQEEDAR